MKKKLFGILLSFGLVLTMIPATVFADGETPIETVNATIAFNSEDVTVSLEEPSPADYSIGDTNLSVFKGDKSIYAYDPNNNNWIKSGTSETVDDLSEVDFDFYLWSLLLIPEPDYVFAETMSSVKINGIELSTEPGETYSDLDTVNTYVNDGTVLALNFKQEKPSSLGETKDVTVDYTYTAGGDIADKEFVVDITYELPTTLTASGPQNVYTWDAENGKYIAPLETEDENSFELENDGAFSITLTNRSNVNIDYCVIYTPNPNAIFASDVVDLSSNVEGTLETVAQGQEVTELGISIVEPDVAIDDMLEDDFYSETCTGTLVISDIQNTPSASGKDTLGTFTIDISEQVIEPTTKSIREIIETVDGGFNKFIGMDETNPFSTITINESGNLLISNNDEMETPQTEEIELDENAVEDGSDYKYTLVDSGAIVTFEIIEDKLYSITVSGEDEETRLNGEYQAQPTITLNYLVNNFVNNFPTNYEDGLKSDGNDSIRCFSDGISLTVTDNDTNNIEFYLSTVLGWDPMIPGYAFCSEDGEWVIVATEDDSPTFDLYSIQFDMNNENLDSWFLAPDPE